MKKKFFIVTTIAETLFFFRGQPRLWKEKFDVCAISHHQDLLKGFADCEEIRYKHFPIRREISPLSDFVNMLRFLLFFLREKPYVVHGNTPKASMLSMVAAWLTNIPVRIYMCHGLRYQSATGKTRKVLMNFERLSCFCANTVICVSNGVKDQLIKDGLCKPDKTKVIFHGTAGGIDTKYFCRGHEYSMEAVSQLEIPADSFVFTFVGRLVRDKGLNELIIAFNKLQSENKDVFLLLIGEREQSLDPVSNETLDIIEANNHIFELGRQNDIRPYLSISSALVLPSYREGVGQVLLEAGCMGVPSIASDIIGCNEVIIPGVNGELIPSHDSDALYQKMKDWVNNPDKIRLMAKTCRNTIVERYDQEKVWKAYLDEYLSYIQDEKRTRLRPVGGHFMQG